MKLYTFQGENPAIALQKAQRACGRDALVVSTKQLQKKSLKATALYEVVVATEAASTSKPALKPLPKKAQTPSPTLDESPAQSDNAVMIDISQRAKALSKALKQEAEPAPEPLQSFTQEEFVKIREDLQTLNQRLSSLQEVLWEDRAEKRNNLAIPPEFAHIYNISKRSGMSKEHLDTIMMRTLEQMPSYMKSNPKTVERYFQVLLKKMIGIRFEKEIPKGSKKIMMFVGPTGVGKTTTLAKIAARFSFIEHHYKVGIITLDTYRIGALDQLFQYAKMMKLPVEDAVDTDDFKAALSRLNHCDLILIDSVGASQYDREKLLKIAHFLESTPHQIDVNLCVAASTKLEDLREIHENFSLMELDTMIVTKFDETKGFGNVFSLASETALPLSYFCLGQEVPDDMMPASSDFLIECIFEGYQGRVS